MKWTPLTPMSLPEVLDILKKSKTFLRSNNIIDTQSFSEKLFTEELPGKVFFELIQEGSKNIGFIKYCVGFPLPGFTHLRLIVIKEELCGKKYGSKCLELLRIKHPGTLWVESIEDQASLPFWKRKGFKKEVDRWVLGI